MSRGVGTLDYAPPARRFGRGIFGWILFIGLAIMLIALFQMKSKSFPPISLSMFIRQAEKGNVAVCTIDGNEITGQFAGSASLPSNPLPVTTFACALPPTLSANWSFIDWMNKTGAEIHVENNQNILIDVLVPFVPWLLIFGFIWFFVFRHVRRDAILRPAPIVATAAPTPAVEHVKEPQ